MDDRNPRSLPFVPCPNLKYLLKCEPEEMNKAFHCCGGTWLHHLLRKRFDEKVLQLINKGADVNLIDSDGQTALIVAIKENSISPDIVKIIAQKTSDINIMDREGKNALHFAISSANSEAVKILLQLGANIDFQDRLGNSHLHCAFHHSLDLVETLVKTGANVNVKNNNGETPLRIAVGAYQMERMNLGQLKNIISILLDKGANINEQTKYGDTILHILGCFQEAPPNIVELHTFLLSKGAEVHLQDRDGVTPLFLAIKHMAEYFGLMLRTESGKSAVNIPDNQEIYPLFLATIQQNFEVVKLLLDNGARIDIKNYYDETPLYITVALGEISEPIFNLLIERGAQVSCRDEYMKTPLHIASYRLFDEHKLMCKTLLSKGASPNVQDNTGMTPLHYAVESSNKDIVQLLVENGAEVNIKNKAGETPLHVSTRRCRDYNTGLHELICKTLLRKGALPNAQDDNGRTPLHNAAKNYTTDIIQILIENGSELNIENTKGETPLHLSTRRGRDIELQELACLTLIANGALINVQDSFGMTPLHNAVKGYTTNIVQLLLENGAELNCKNKKGELPIRYVRKVDTLEVLLQNGAEVNEQNNYGRTVLHNIAKDFLKSPSSDDSRKVVKLLEWGASQNIKDNLGKLPFDYYSFKVAQKVYEIKRTSLYKTYQIEKDGSNSYNFQRLHERCCVEIDRMKLEIFGKNTLYDIFRHYDDPHFLSNGELECAVLFKDLNVKFPVYCSMLTSTYLRSRVRVQLFHHVVDILQTPLPFEVVRYILTFVDDDSLKNVIKAKEEPPVKKKGDTTSKSETEPDLEPNSENEIDSENESGWENDTDSECDSDWETDSDSVCSFYWESESDE